MEALDAAQLPHFLAGGLVAVLHRKLPGQRLVLGPELGTAVVLAAFDPRSGAACPPRLAAVVEWPTQAAARRAKVISLDALHGQLLRDACAKYAYSLANHGQVRFEAGDEVPIPMVGVTARVGGSLKRNPLLGKKGVKKGKKKASVKQFGAWVYDSWINKGLRARVRTALITAMDAGVNADWAWLKRTVPAAAELIRHVRGAYAMGLPANAKNNKAHVAVRVGLADSGFTASSAVANYHAKPHRDKRDMAFVGSVIEFLDMLADGSPAPEASQGNDFAITALNILVSCPSATRLWLDTLTFEHHGLPLSHLPAGVVRVSSARTVHRRTVRLAEDFSATKRSRELMGPAPKRTPPPAAPAPKRRRRS